MAQIGEPTTLLLPAWAAQFKTRDGIELNVRPASPDDEQLLIKFFRQVSPQDLRYRFLSSLKTVGSELAHEMVTVDHTETENLLAFDARDEQLVATAMIASPSGTDDAEVAVCVRSDLKGRGIGWAMLNGACDYSKLRGFKKVHSVELSDNRDVIRLEEEMGFKARPCADDMSLTILTKELA
jgi:GNAT superfamily N-acetyltransferase